MDCEVLYGDVSQRALRMLDALIATAEEAGVRIKVSEKWTNSTPVLMSYGLGHPLRSKWTEAHVKAGGRLIGWDLAYWDRDNAMRCTVDHLHPWRLIRDMPADRWESAGISLREDADPEGPIVLIGMGRKSRSQFSMFDRAWERESLKQIKKNYPGKTIIYKPKRPEDLMPGCVTVNGHIEEALKGASLVVCRHSNVAVDACIAGVQVVCEDGAAKVLYNNDLSNPVNPSKEARLRFLQNLAYWQWKPSEARDAWKFLRTVLG
jgi:hypothetical protein